MKEIRTVQITNQVLKMTRRQMYTQQMTLKM